MAAATLITTASISILLVLTASILSSSQTASAFQIHGLSSPVKIHRFVPKGTLGIANNIRSCCPESWYYRHISNPLQAANNDDRDGGMGRVDEYRNGVTAFLANFMQSPSTTGSPASGPSGGIDSNGTNGADANSANDPLASINFNAPKSRKMSLQDLASKLDAELYEKEWFVTGNVNPIYFSPDFQFQDPDVKLTGIEDYARGVLKLFDQSSSRAQIISTVVNTTVPNTITVTWRLSGRVNIGPNGLPIKPYICYTDFTVDETTGLVTFQEDRFDIPGWDILLSALFPFLVGRVPFLKEAAPEVEPRVVNVAVKEEGIFDGLFQKIGL